MPSIEDTEFLVAAGRIAHVRRLGKTQLEDPIEPSRLPAKAAAHGRVAILEHMAQQGVRLDDTLLLTMGVLGDQVPTMIFLEKRGVATCTPISISVALPHDSARVMRHWLKYDMLQDPVSVAHQSVHHDSLHCFRVLERHPAVKADETLYGYARARAKARIASYLGAELPSSTIAGPAAPARPQYTYLTPSEHIDPDLTSIRFLLYRRVMRLLFVRSR